MSQQRSGDGVAPSTYLAVGVAYVLLGLLMRSWVLNWIVGPLFLVVLVDVLPRLSRARPAGGGPAR